MQPCKTGDQQYSDASPYSECSLGSMCMFFIVKCVCEGGERESSEYISK